jgi:hypothetical protein
MFFESAGARGAGIVHQDVDLAERPHRLLIRALQVGGNGDVARNADNARLGRFPDRDDSLIQRLAPARDDCHRGAGLGKARRHGKADALAPAGNDGGAPVKNDFHVALS